ncbi:MAG: dmdB [Betaproteobacteria bacterium]|jgi:3-isopropylmalate dehydratase small subunit|nr:dmdB [Betaproteobacteria bacterium]MEA3153051.1 3-isopropylmalate/(R)-2-methylmalate dehydratase small subunit [Betaproteobacteria bacterium]
MQKIKGRAHLLPEEINTDLHCSAKYMPGKDTAYVAQHAFEQIAPQFVSGFKPGDVIVAGRNFGINSSREQAVHAMRLLGVAAVVAPAFGRQFFRNAINNGLPVVECDISGIDQDDALEIDLTAGVMNVLDPGLQRVFPPLPAAIQTLLAAGGLIPFLQRYPDWKVA